jgi:hypothetical protein
MKLLMKIGIRKPSTLLVPPGSPTPNGELHPLTEENLEAELGGPRYVSLAFPVGSLNGRVTSPKDMIEIHVSTPDETPLMDQEAISALLDYFGTYPDYNAGDDSNLDRALEWLESKLPE